MPLSPRQRRWAAMAAREGMALALWRAPGAAAPLLALSRAPTRAVSVFGPDAAGPGFCLSRFDAPSGARTDFLAAESIIGPDGPRDPGDPGDLAAKVEALAAEDAVLPAPVGAPAPACLGRHAYLALVAEAVSAIRAGVLTKVVTSRAQACDLAPGTDLLDLFATLEAAYPHACVALVARPGQDAWLVATPEVLLSVADGTVRTMALAGTQPRLDQRPSEAVAWTDKFIAEQALVARYIRRAFTEAGFPAPSEEGPRTARAGNLWHLRSLFETPLPDGADLTGLVDRLQPTSAVLGDPKDAARAFLEAHEGYDRACYTGFLGPVGIDGESTLYVNLRTAQIIGDRLYLYVGGGIVAGSDPQEEWSETVAKTRTIGAVLGLV